jgi:hypothetical protein
VSLQAEEPGILVGLPDFGPNNEHELAIATVVDAMSLQVISYSTAVEAATASLAFTISKPDADFLLQYVRWRMDHPIVK